MFTESEIADLEVLIRAFVDAFVKHGAQPGTYTVSGTTCFSIPEAVAIAMLKISFPEKLERGPELRTLAGDILHEAIAEVRD